MPRLIALWFALFISSTIPVDGYSKLLQPRLETIPESESESDSEEGEGKCTPIDEREGESRYCYVHSGELTGLGYSLEVTDDERVQALTVLCPRKNYTVTIDGIVEIEHQGESYDVKIDDPLKDFNKRAFDETECPVTFRNIQTEILKKEGAAVDEGPSSLCKEIADEFCSIYEQATAGVNLTT